MSSVLTGSADPGNSTPNPAPAGNPPVTPDPTATPPSWHASLPPELKDNPSLKLFTDVGGLAKSYLHAQQSLSKKGVIPPGEKATDEEWHGFFKQIGLPEQDKYELPVATDKKMDEDFIKNFKEVAHKQGILPKQANAILAMMAERTENKTKQTVESHEAEIKAGIEGLKKEWGHGFEKQINMAKMAVKEAGGPEFATWLEKTGLGNDATFIKVMAKVGSFIGEDKLRGAAAGSVGSTPAEAQAKIDKIMGDLKHPYFDKAHPAHNSAMAEMEALMKQRYS